LRGWPISRPARCRADLADCLCPEIRSVADAIAHCGCRPGLAAACAQ